MILLTGATGFVGRQVLKALATRGLAVRAVVRQGTEARLPEPVASVMSTPDLFAEDAAWWAKACAGIDTAIHAAWYAEPGNYLHSPQNKECLAGTLVFAEGAAAAGLRRFVGVGTCFEYDVSAGDLSVRTPLKPATPYAEAKAAAFAALSDFLPRNGVAFAWCRLFYLYGEGEDRRRLVPTLRNRLSRGEPVDLTGGTQVRDFLDVREAGAMIAEVALGTATGPVNICSGVPITIRALAERIADQYGRRDLLRFGVRPDNAFDPPRIVGVR
ncbi:MAG: NAD-dependent epimerase/dehydratase family protein [Pseudolabrys sp.]